MRKLAQTAGSPPDVGDAGARAGRWLQEVQHVPGTNLTKRYFAERPDGLRLASGEDVLVATT